MHSRSGQVTVVALGRSLRPSEGSQWGGVGEQAIMLTRRCSLLTRAGKPFAQRDARLLRAGTGLGVASTRGTATASACSRRPASGRSDRDRSADGGGDILNGVRGDLGRQHRSRLTRLAQFGQAAWFFGNLYEGLVGMPQLLADAGAARDRGLLNVGSPVRYFAPVAPLAVGASAFDLISRWRSKEDGDRHLVAVTGTTITIAVGISVYLIRVVNIALLTHHGPLPRLDDGDSSARGKGSTPSVSSA
jgi:hypothetical protein